MVLRYEGLDKVVRTSAISFSQRPDQLTSERADFVIAVTKRSSQTLYVEVGNETDDRPESDRFRAEFRPVAESQVLASETGFMWM